ncbi:MAG: hypothetical protein M3025_01230, partial [Actinomycetota bacterium]|nr:hypothetical protein [Actinomycetota bacterium]
MAGLFLDRYGCEDVWVRTREVQRLWSLLSGEVAERLAAEGWEAVGPDPAPGSMRVCIGRPLGNGFVATIGVSSDFLSGSGGLAVLRPSVRVGIGYEPLIALMPLLGEGRASVLEEEVGLPADLDASEKGDRRIGAGLPWVSTAADVPVAAEAIARLAPGRALAFAESLASVDMVLEALGARRDRSLAVAEMLAAAGRFDEATEVLAGCRAPQVDALPALERIVGRSYRRSVYQLRRWIDGRGDLALLPPPASRDRSAEQESAGGFGELCAEWAAIKRVRRAVADR